MDKIFLIKLFCARATITFLGIITQNNLRKLKKNQIRQIKVKVDQPNLAVKSRSSYVVQGAK